MRTSWRSFFVFALLLVAVSLDAQAPVTMADSRPHASGRTFVTPANHTFTQKFTAKTTGYITEVGVVMGMMHMPWNARVTLDAGGARLLDQNYTGMTQRREDGIAVFPITGMTKLVNAGEVVSFSVTPDIEVQLEPVLVDNTDWPRAELPDYGRVALEFYVLADPAVTITATAPAGGKIAFDALDCGAKCTATVRAGIQATLTAVPKTESTFVSWGGACAGQANPCKLTVSANTAVTAKFKQPPVIKWTRDIQLDNGMRIAIREPGGQFIAGDGCTRNNPPTFGFVETMENLSLRSVFTLSNVRGLGGNCFGTNQSAGYAAHLTMADGSGRVVFRGTGANGAGNGSPSLRSRGPDEVDFEFRLCQHPGNWVDLPVGLVNVQVGYDTRGASCSRQNIVNTNCISCVDKAFYAVKQTYELYVITEDFGK